MTVKILSASHTAIKMGASIIRKGGLVAFPTETVYGLGADALNPNAVARIFEVKRRPFFDPIIVHISDFKMASEICFFTEIAKKLAAHFWPGPLTLVLKKKRVIPEIVTAGLPTVAVRMPSHPVAQKFIKFVKKPVAAPSANPFGYLSPTTAQHVKEQIGAEIDLIIDAGKCPVGIESTVLDISNKKPSILRMGGIPVEDIESVIGKVNISLISKKGKKMLSPGQLPKHYSPRTPLKLVGDKKIKIPKKIKAGLLAFKEPTSKDDYKIIEVLSKNGDLREAAVNFFSALHRLDNANLDVIYAEKVPEVMLGRAIMDRLRKASGSGVKK